jgi:hypothetical protein
MGGDAESDDLNVNMNIVTCITEQASKRVRSVAMSREVRQTTRWTLLSSSNIDMGGALVSWLVARGRLCGNETISHIDISDGRCGVVGVGC